MTMGPEGSSGGMVRRIRPLQSVPAVSGWPVGPITRPGWGRLRCRRGAISACTWSGYFEGIDSARAGMALLGPCRYGSFYIGRDDHSLSRTRARLPVHGSDRRGGSGQGRASGSMGPWRPTRRCDCGGTRARVTGGCWRAWPRRAASRHPRPRTCRAWTASASGRSSPPGLGLEERPRGQDRQDEGRHDPSGLQARARGGSGHRRGGGRRATPGRRGRHDDAEKTPPRPRRISRRWTRHRRAKTRPNV